MPEKKKSKAHFYSVFPDMLFVVFIKLYITLIHPYVTLSFHKNKHAIKQSTHGSKTAYKKSSLLAGAN